MPVWPAYTTISVRQETFVPAARQIKRVSRALTARPTARHVRQDRLQTAQVHVFQGPVLQDTAPALQHVPRDIQKKHLVLQADCPVTNALLRPVLRDTVPALRVRPDIPRKHLVLQADCPAKDVSVLHVETAAMQTPKKSERRCRFARHSLNGKSLQLESPGMQHAMPASAKDQPLEAADVAAVEKSLAAEQKARVVSAVTIIRPHAVPVRNVPTIHAAIVRPEKPASVRPARFQTALAAALPARREHITRPAAVPLVRQVVRHVQVQRRAKLVRRVTPFQTASVLQENHVQRRQTVMSAKNASAAIAKHAAKAVRQNPSAIRVEAAVQTKGPIPAEAVQVQRILIVRTAGLRHRHRQDTRVIAHQMQPTGRNVLQAVTR